VWDSYNKYALIIKDIIAKYETENDAESKKDLIFSMIFSKRKLKCSMLVHFTISKILKHISTILVAVIYIWQLKKVNRILICML